MKFSSDINFHLFLELKKKLKTSRNPIPLHGLVCFNCSYKYILKPSEKKSRTSKEFLCLSNRPGYKNHKILAPQKIKDSTV